MVHHNSYFFLFVLDKTIKLWKVSERDKKIEGYNTPCDPHSITSLKVRVCSFVLKPEYRFEAMILHPEPEEIIKLLSFVCKDENVRCKKKSFLGTYFH